MNQCILPFCRVLEQPGEQYCEIEVKIAKDIYAETSRSTTKAFKQGEKARLIGLRGSVRQQNSRSYEAYSELALFKDDKYYTVWFETVSSPPDFFIEEVIQLDMGILEHIEKQRTIQLGKGAEMLHIEVCI